MTAPAVPTYRALLRPAFTTAGAALVAFGLAHVAFITWAADRSEDPSLLARLAVMFAAPFTFGIPFAIVAALLGAAAWHATRARGRLRSWRYGAALALALLPPIALSLAVGPLGDDTPPLPVMALTIGGIVLLPTLVGVWAGGPRGALLGLAPAPLVIPWTMFLVGEGLVGWVVPFVASLVAILVGSGWLMERLVARAAPPGPDALP